MKIKEFLIRRYGPLPDSGRIILRDFNLFWGKNENGKTLTIDALVKLLLGHNIRNFEHIDRVEENPEGYVIIEYEKGKEIKLPEKGNLTKVADLTPSECCNIFIVRNSNLSIGRESEFYTNVTDRLTGLRTEEIQKIMGILREIGKITPTGMFRDIKEEKLKTRIEKAKTLLEKKIKSLDREIKEKRFDELEGECVRQREKIDEIDQKIKSLEDARKREKYEKGKETLDNLKESLEILKDLEIYNEKDEQLWRVCERDIKIYNEEKENLSEELKGTEREFEKINEKLSEVERNFRIFEEIKRKLDDEIKLDLDNYKRKRRELVQQKMKSKFFSSVGIISAILFGISLLGVIFSPSLLFYILAILFSILAMISWIFKFQFERNKASLAEIFEKIKLTLSKFKLSAENIEGILSNIQRVDELYREESEKLQEIKRKKERLEEKIKDLHKKIQDIENKIKDAEKKIEETKIKSKVESLENYSKKLKSKQELERSIGEQKSVLKSHFGKRGEKLEENIPFWWEEIEKLEKYKDEAKNIEYNEDRKTELKEKKQELEQKLKTLEEEMESIQEKMEEIERKANEILRLEEEYLHCKTSVDLRAVKDKLQRFIDENESNRDNVLEVIEIFEEIEAEEREKISELFGRESPISKYFNEITDGLYEEVTFNQGTGRIEVKRKDGEIIEAEKLSGGAYDQLYFSIRLALGEKLLKGKKGFFIMDDPFIKADIDRLQRQMETLKKISELGWQVMYFSAKDEIKDVLKEDISCDTINYVELRGIFS
ncbi:hypothetical protein J7J39_02070 [bacterium]|nr:hypothetical protein [bacterium]